MTASRPRPAHRTRQAITLMELMLVLALLVIMGSLAWPTLERTFDTQRLRKSADLIRAEWARARVQALSTGRTHIFQYVVEGNRYATHRRTGDDVSLDIAAGGGPGDFGEAVSATPSPFERERELPEGVTFVGSQTTSDSRAEMVAADATQFRPPDQGWSEPIFFYPDGTTSTARLVLKNQRGRTVGLFLRGLTGVVTAGDVQVPEGELP